MINTDNLDLEKWEASDLVSAVFDAFNDNADKIDGITSHKGSLANSTDLNTVIDAGTYYFTSGTTLTNKPDGVTFGWLIVFKSAIDATPLAQMIIGQNGQVLARRKGDTTWSDWVLIGPASVTYTLLRDDINLSSNGTSTFTDTKQHNLYMVLGYDTATGITAWHSCIVPASATPIRYAHRFHADTMPFTLVRSGTSCTLKREGTTGITYKVYGIG